MNINNNKPIIEIDDNSGFCFGVVTAIDKAEAELERSGKLYCLGDIVHNASEVERLERRGLDTITHSDLERLHDATVLLRAHGEPPSTYLTAERNNISIVDATCPVVLQLQKRIKTAYAEGLRRVSSGDMHRMPLILIYGKAGHAEVNGLVGQTDGTAVVVQRPEDIEGLDLSGDVLLYSQTTQPLDGFHRIIEEIKKRKSDGRFEYFDTICRQVANRLEGLRQFAADHDAIVFVSGAKSSNGKVLFEECKKVNPHTIMVSDDKDLDIRSLQDASTIGICGATSTPRWLMARIADLISEGLEHSKG